jgi:hypothetical protein
VRHEPRKHRRFCQQRVDAVGLQAFKIVAALEIACQMRRQRSADFGNTVLRQNTFKDQVAATIELFTPRRERPPPGRSFARDAQSFNHAHNRHCIPHVTTAWRRNVAVG